MQLRYVAQQSVLDLRKMLHLNNAMTRIVRMALAMNANIMRPPLGILMRKGPDANKNMSHKLKKE